VPQDDHRLPWHLLGWARSQVHLLYLGFGCWLIKHENSSCFLEYITFARSISLFKMWPLKQCKSLSSDIRPSSFFSLFSIVRPTQIFVFSKKKVNKRQWRQWHIISNNCHFNLKHKQFFALQIFSFSLFSFDFNNDVGFFLTQLPRCWLCSHTLLFPGSTDIMR